MLEVHELLSIIRHSDFDGEFMNESFLWCLDQKVHFCNDIKVLSKILDLLDDLENDQTVDNIRL